jgi:hypothetical protein
VRGTAGYLPRERHEIERSWDIPQVATNARTGRYRSDVVVAGYRARPHMRVRPGEPPPKYLPRGSGGFQRTVDRTSSTPEYFFSQSPEHAHINPDN